MNEIAAGTGLSYVKRESDRESAMLGWLMELRDFLLALTLAWVGISLADTNADSHEKTGPVKPTIEAMAQDKCDPAQRH